MAITTAEEFLRVLKKSELVSPQQFRAARTSGRPGDDPTAMARVLVQKDLLTRWQAGQLLAGRSSFFLGKYKLIELLGRGGMGSVFLGQHTMMNRRVALKILARPLGKDPEALERFLAEARLIATLDHPNIVHAYSIDNEADRYYMVMEYVDGQDLEELVETEGPLEYRQAADYVRQAADGLAHGHGRNIIHCDIKPSHLLANRQGVVKIVDMGLARLSVAWASGPPRPPSAGTAKPLRPSHRRASHRRASHNNGCGGQDEKALRSVDYLSPEQALESPNFDHRTDIYSLGCTFYYLLTGHPPFPKDLSPERLMKHQTQQPQSILEQRRDAPKALVDLCRRMMAKRPEDRPQSADEVSRTLDAWLLAKQPPTRTIPLKRAEALDEPTASGLPSIELGAARKPCTAEVAKAGKSSEVGLLKARRRKMAAAVVAGLMLVLVLAIVVPLWIVAASNPGENRRLQAKANRGGVQKTRPSVVEAAMPARPRTVRYKPASDGAAADEPPPDQPPIDGPKPVDPPPEAPKVRSARTELRPAPPQPEKPKPEKPETEKPETEKPETEKPETEKPKAERPKPDGPKLDNPKPDKPKTTEKEKDPFGELPEAVSLPVLDAKTPADGQPGEPFALSTLHGQPEAAWNIKLKSGEGAEQRNRHFSLEQQEEEKGWLVYVALRTGVNAAPGRTKVARIWRDHETLKFQWLKDARRARANYLRNSGLLIRVDGKTRWLPFTVPTAVPPLVLNLDSGRAVTPLPAADWTPKVDALRIEITKLEGPLPKPEFKPADRISENGRLDILLRKEKLPDLGLHVAFVTKRRRPEVELSAHFQLPDKGWYPLSRSELGKQAVQWAAGYQRLKGITDRMDRKHPGRKMFRQQREALKSGVEQIDALGEAIGDIHNLGIVHFRVFTIVGDHKVVLFTTKEG